MRYTAFVETDRDSVELGTFDTVDEAHEAIYSYIDSNKLKLGENCGIGVVESYKLRETPTMLSHSGVIQAIEKAAFENGVLGLDVIKFAAECGYGHYTFDGEWYLDRHDLQEIADIFCDNSDVINY